MKALCPEMAEQLIDLQLKSTCIDKNNLIIVTALDPF